MPNTHITKAALRNHLHYGKWVYLVIVAACWFLGDLLFTMTEYRPPDERKVTFQIVAPYSDLAPLEALAPRLLEEGRALDGTLEQIEFFSILYSGDPDTDYYGAQKYATMLAAQEGDVYLLPEKLLEQLAAQEALWRMDELLDDDALDACDAREYAIAIADPETGETRCGCVLRYSKNPETSARALCGVAQMLDPATKEVF